MKQFITSLLGWCVLTFSIFSCKSPFYGVVATLETDPVKSPDDAADDPCIYIHFGDPSKNAIIGTDKQKGLIVYNTSGKIIHEYDFGRINNVDLRQGIQWNNDEITIVGGSNRTNNSIVFYRLNDPDQSLTPLHNEVFASKVNEVYGFCMYQGPQKLYAFVVGKDGMVEQWFLSPTRSGQLNAKVVRNFNVGSKCEGMVVDDQLAHLYIGEEEVGIWKYSAKATADDQRTAVLLLESQKLFKADIEGLTILYRPNQKGYLIASVQGNNSYAIFKRDGENDYLGSFQIKNGKTIDGTSDTDGIDVSAAKFSNQFPEGVFVAQDGKNNGASQNFKLVDWRIIEELIKQ